jgi:uncharacterized membrane protein
MNPDLVNGAALAVFIGCVALYAAVLHRSLRDPATAKRGLLNLLYRAWVKRVSHMENTIVGVQSMRNLIMSTTFLSSAILVLLGLLVRNFEDWIDLTGAPAHVMEIKLLLLFGVLVFALMMFLLSLRHMVRFTILIGVPPEDIEQTSCRLENGEKGELEHQPLRQKVFERATHRFTFGIRAIYYLLAVILWFLNPYAFVGATVVITALLIFYQDVKTPCPEEEEAPI